MEPPLHLFPLMCNHCHPPAESSSKAFGLSMLIISCRKKRWFEQPGHCNKTSWGSKFFFKKMTFRVVWFAIVPWLMYLSSLFIVQVIQRMCLTSWTPRRYTIIYSLPWPDACIDLPPSLPAVTSKWRAPRQRWVGYSCCSIYLLQPAVIQLHAAKKFFL